MNVRQAEGLLTALRRAIRHIALYPQGHPLVRDALVAGAEAADDVAADGEAVLTLLDDAFYLGTELLGHASLEFNGMLREMQERGIDSITMIRPVAADDLAELVAFIAGESDDVPAGSTIRLNERPLSYEDLRKSDTAGLRRSYTGSLEVLRSIGMAVRSEGEFGLGGVAVAVENLLKASLEQPGASLLLATVKSHDEYTFYHSVNTCILSLAMGRLVGLDEDQLRLLGMGALLHDIGKVGVAPSVLRNPGRLVSTDWDQIKLHPQEGAQSILAASGAGQELAAAIALEHHARFDGSGYPKLGHDDGHAGHHHGNGNGDGHNGHGGKGYELHFF
jgi:HD-GYP domain-containing protein (c-di-GMP phosphodiesterase class II)